MSTASIGIIDQHRGPGTFPLRNIAFEIPIPWQTSYPDCGALEEVPYKSRLGRIEYQDEISDVHMDFESLCVYAHIGMGNGAYQTAYESLCCQLCDRECGDSFVAVAWYPRRRNVWECQEMTVTPPAGVKADFSDVFERCLFQTDSVATLPVDAVNKTLELNHVVCIRGLISPLEVQAARVRIAGNFRREEDRPSAGNEPAFFKRNYQKLRVGTSDGSNPVSRLVRTFYNPLWEEDIYGMHAIFRTMIRLRNTLIGEALDFASNRDDDGLWTASRIHQYPAGGGFMSEHRDEGAAPHNEKRGLKYLQIILVMSTKGIDYERGGAFIVHQQGRYCFDDGCQCGDIIVYNGLTMHGVADIDPHKTLDLDTLSGRMAAFVTLWENR